MLTSDDLSELIERLDAVAIQDEDITKGTIDFPENNPVVHLIEPIAKCVGVRMWTSTRTETNLLTGQTEQHKCITVFGLHCDVDTVYWLFERATERLETILSNYLQRHLFELGHDSRRVMRFRFQTVKEIQKQLEQITDYLGEQKNEIISAAFARLNIRIVRKKVDLTNAYKDIPLEGSFLC